MSIAMLHLPDFRIPPYLAAVDFASGSPEANL